MLDIEFQEKIAFDGLWIDMNEPANFVAGDMNDGCAGSGAFLPKNICETVNESCRLLSPTKKDVKRNVLHFFLFEAKYYLLLSGDSCSLRVGRIALYFL